MVSVQGALSSASCCLALAKECGTGYGPSLQLREPKGDAAGWHETWHSSEHSSLSLGIACPRASKGIGVTRWLQSAN